MKTKPVKEVDTSDLVGLNWRDKNYMVRREGGGEGGRGVSECVGGRARIFHLACVSLFIS